MATERLLQDVVKELVELEMLLVDIDARKLIKRSEELRKEIIGITQDVEADYAADLALTTNEGYQVIFGPKPIQHIVTNKKRLKKLLGAAQFEQLATFTVKDLEPVLNKTDLYSVTTLTHGTRRFKEAHLLQKE